MFGRKDKAKIIVIKLSENGMELKRFSLFFDHLLAIKFSFSTFIFKILVEREMKNSGTTPC